MDPGKSKRTFQRAVTKKLEESKAEEDRLKNQVDFNIQTDHVLSGEDTSSGTFESTHHNLSATVIESASTATAYDFEDVYVGLEKFTVSDDDSHTSDSDANLLHPFTDLSESETDESGCDAQAELTLAEKIARLALTHRLTHAAINALLALFSSLGHGLPKDARTILGTTRSKSNENFEHFGLIRGIVRKIKKGVPSGIHILQLQVSMDGLPLFRSSKTNFWPILCRILNCNDSRPFVVSVFCGESKPPDLEEYLRNFIDEMLLLEKRSLKVGTRSYHVELKSIICDAPARSFVKAIIGHTGFFACERCVQKGVKIGGAMTFPNLNAPLRNGNSFRRKTNRDHHSGESPLERLNIDMVYGFGLDYMHLVCQGVMKRLLLLWRGRRKTKSSRKQRKSSKTTNKSKDLAHRLPAEQQEIINKRISAARDFFPVEFQRKGRSLDDIEVWKAVEYRHFLLYSGPIIMRNMLTKEKYDHFLYFHVAIRLLTSSSTQEVIEYADKMLKYFVDQFGKIYGSHHLVYNVHSLSHLANECKFQKGPLDSFCAFPFENYLGQLKNLLRGTRKPLAQLKKRLSEIENNETVENPAIWNTYKFDLRSIKPSSRADGFLMTKKGQILKVKEVSQLHIMGSELELKDSQQNSFVDLFDEPFRSSFIKIYVSSGRIINEEISISLSAENCKDFVKCVGITFEGGKIAFFPLLHNL